MFEHLDGFDHVDIDLSDLRAGPFDVASFKLTRDGSSAAYHLVAHARTTGSAITEYGADRLGLPVSPLLGIVTGKVSAANKAIPVDLDMGLKSENGRVVVVSGGAKIAGFPTGPLAELITSAIVVRL